MKINCLTVHCIKFMSAQYAGLVFQFDELIDSYEFNLAALVQRSTDRSIFGSIAHNRVATLTSYGPTARHSSQNCIYRQADLKIKRTVFT